MQLRLPAEKGRKRFGGRVSSTCTSTHSILLSQGHIIICNYLYLNTCIYFYTAAAGKQQGRRVWTGRGSTDAELHAGIYCPYVLRQFHCCLRCTSFACCPC